MVAAPPSRAAAPPPPRSANFFSRAHAYEIVDTDHGVVRVGDLDFAAFLLYRDVPLVNAVMKSPQERYFDFWDPEGTVVPRLAMEFVSSPEAGVLECVRRLKKVTYMVPQGRRPWEER